MYFKVNKSQDVIDYWCKVPKGSANDIVRLLQDAHIIPHTDPLYTAHDALFNCEDCTMELVEFDNCWKYMSSHIDEIDELLPKRELSYDKMVEYLKYLAGE
jgi:hypothetical protein